MPVVKLLAFTIIAMICCDSVQVIDNVSGITKLFIHEIHVERDLDVFLKEDKGNITIHDVYTYSNADEGVDYSLVVYRKPNTLETFWTILKKDDEGIYVTEYCKGDSINVEPLTVISMISYKDSSHDIQIVGLVCPESEYKPSALSKYVSNKLSNLRAQITQCTKNNQRLRIREQRQRREMNSLRQILTRVAPNVTLMQKEAEYHNDQVSISYNQTNLKTNPSDREEIHKKMEELQGNSAHCEVIRTTLIIIVAVLVCVCILIAALWYRSYRKSKIHRIQQIPRFVKKYEPQRSVLQQHRSQNLKVNREIQTEGDETIVARFEPEKFSDLLDNSQMVQNVIVDDIINDLQTAGVDN